MGPGRIGRRVIVAVANIPLLVQELVQIATALNHCRKQQQKRTIHFVSSGFIKVTKQLT